MRRGFTLLELMIVIIIIAILALIAVPQFFNVARRAKISTVRETLGAAARYASQYRSIYGGFPNLSTGSTHYMRLDGQTANENNADMSFTMPSSEAALCTNYSTSGDILTATCDGIKSGCKLNVNFITAAINQTGCE